MTRKLLFTVAVLAGLMLAPTMAAAYSTQFNIIVVNETDEPMEWVIQCSKHGSGTLQPHSRKIIKTSQTAYFEKESTSHYSFSLVYGHDKGAVWDFKLVNIYSTGPQFVKDETHLEFEHQNVPFWNIAHSTSTRGNSTLNTINEITYTITVANQ